MRLYRRFPTIRPPAAGRPGHRQPALVPCLVFLAALIAAPARAGEPVTLLLRWDHQFQFAGYYAAQWQGYYADAGLDVTMRTPFTEQSQILDSVEEVVSGRADFAIGAADILIARDQGKPVVVLATIFNQSAAEFYIRKDSGFASIADIPRLAVARRLNDLLDYEFQAMLLAEGIDPATVQPKKPFGNANDIASGDVDLIPGYSFVTAHLLTSMGVEFYRLRPSDFGINFYGDSLFTSEEMIRHREKTVNKFVEASLRGWQYALENPTEIADLIAQRLQRRFPVADPVAFNRAQIDGVLRSTLYPVVEPGHVNPGRWQHMHDWLEMAGLIANPIDLDAFIYDPLKRREASQRRLLELFAGLAIVAAALGVVSWIWFLRRAVRARTAELDLSQRNLTEAQNLATLGQLTATVSHELRNPLGVIRNAAFVLEKKFDGQDEKVARALERIDRSIARCDRIVGDLLDFTRIPTSPFEPTEIDVWLSQTLADLTPPDGVRTACELGAPGVVVPVDHERLHRVIINLQENACQAMQGCENPVLTFRTRPSNGGVTIEVADNGAGMDAETLDRAFEPLFSTKNFGFGLGLPTVRQIMIGHSGDVAIESTPGQGTTVSLWLPGATPAEGQA